MPGAVSIMGPDCVTQWELERDTPLDSLDVMLLTHPRDTTDLQRIFPWAADLTVAERTGLTRHIKPIVGEVIDTGLLRIGIMFLPFYASDVIDPMSRNRCRTILERDAINTAGGLGAKVISLGGLTGALSLYGRRLLKPAETAGITMTTGHAVTAIGTHETYRRAVADLNLDPADQRVVILGIGSIGQSVVKLLTAVESSARPREIVLVDKPQLAGKLQRMALGIYQECGIPASSETCLPDGSLPESSACYHSDVVISAVSTANVIDVGLVRPGTVLIDDSQPYCWPRDTAASRMFERYDIAPCEAGLIDCSSVGFTSQFPFDFADAVDGRSPTAWSCLTEGILLALDPSLPPTVGEPTNDSLLPYSRAFTERGLTTPSLQCAADMLPVAGLRDAFQTVRLARSART